MSGCTCRLFIPVCTGSGSGMQNPLANIHSVSISRQQVQRIFSFSLRSRAVHRSAPDKPLDYGVCRSSTLFQRTLVLVLRCFSGGGSFLSSGLHTSDCTTSDCVASGHLPCALQHTKRVISLKEHSRVERLFKDASF